MPSALAPLLRDLTPPLLWRGLAGLRARLRGAPEWEYIPAGWAYADSHPEVSGWDVQSVADVYRAKWPGFVAAVQGSRSLDFTHEAPVLSGGDLSAHNAVMSFAYVLGRVAQEEPAPSLLDWGGGCGHYAVLARALYPRLALDYHCRDLPLLAGLGAEFLPGDHFYSDDACLARRYDLVMANTSFHYNRAWQSRLAGLVGATGRYFYAGNFPITTDADSFVFVQRPYAYGYATEYLAWCLNREEFLAEATRLGLGLEREFVYGYAPKIHNAPGGAGYRGFLFRAEGKRSYSYGRD